MLKKIYEIERSNSNNNNNISLIYTATWTRGHICDYNENKKEFIYLDNLYIVLKSLNNSSNPGKSFFDEVIIVSLKQINQIKLN